MLAPDALQLRYRQKNHAGRTSLVELDVVNGVSMHSWCMCKRKFLCEVNASLDQAKLYVAVRSTQILFNVSCARRLCHQFDLLTLVEVRF